MHILIVDDEEISRKTLAAAMTARGHTVHVAADGEEAWRLFQEHQQRLSLLLLDWMMPPPDGLEVIKRVRAVPSTHYIHIIFLTARESDEDILAGFAAGANDYITKPYNPSELEARVNVGLRVAALEESLAVRIKELEQALRQVTHLQSLLPICSYCKKVRNDRNYWDSVEQYLAEHTGVKFSHAVCPDCYRRIMQELDQPRGKS